MDYTKQKKYKMWYHIFLVLGLFGLLDIIVGVLMRQSGFDFEDGGGLTFMIIYAFMYIFGTKVATSILPFVMFISFTWFIWLGISAILRRDIKKLEKETDIVSEVKTEKPTTDNRLR